jgi:hypothetical protein
VPRGEWFCEVCMELNSDSPSIPLTEESCISESNKDNFDNPLHVSNENETKYDNGNSNNNYSLLAETTTISNSSRCDLDPVEPLPLTSTARKFEKYVLLRLYYRPEDTPSGRKSHHHKVFVKVKAVKRGIDPIVT